MDGASQVEDPPLPSFEIRDCVLGYHIPTFLVLEELCACLKQVTKDREFTLSRAYVGLCLLGSVLLLLSLVVTSNLITKSSTAVHITILMLYEMLQQSAVGLLASFTLAKRRDMVHKVASAMYLLGTWGVNYTLLDLTAEQILTAVWPKLAQTYVTPMKSLRRSGLVMVLGMVSSGPAFFHAIASYEKTIGISQIPVTCEQRDYYFDNWRIHKTFLLVTFWLVPMVVLVCFFLVLLGHVLQTRVFHKHQYGHPIHSHITRRDIEREQISMLCLVGWQMCLILLHLSHMLVVLWTHDTDSLQLTEVVSLVSLVTTPFCLLLWHHFREEGVKSFSCSVQQQPKSLHSASRYRSVQSLSFSWGV